MFGIFSLAPTQDNRRQKGNTKLTSVYILKELWSMVGASTVIDKIGNVLQTISLYDSTIGHSGFHMDVSHHYGLGEYKHSKHCYKSQRNSDWHQSPSPQSLMLMTHTYQHGCMTCHASAKVFTCDTRFLHAGIGSKYFFPH
jgi:hypothetical protein